ncbi:OLC1v1020414C1 [Oldenlandia corymbosa var. corymbosa]|uniref:OLC1v1020414C1 n=1 Tax=Oldenlandia corymbosa var. corymbosa TaxID=529605 RepID=A0AAV1EGW3_OLDCO|nr:OLC1v1020414C1 [Oldenlandia corymbosa var. corymbosa]
MSDFAPSIPNDLIVDILVRLPAKSVGRFRCVSKPWRSLLSSFRFIRAHTDFHLLYDLDEKIVLSASRNSVHSPDSLHILTFFTNESERSSSIDGISKEVSFPLLHPNDQFVVVKGSCHGLVLLMNPDSYSICLANPVTLEVVKIPDFCSPLDFDGISYGLGYDNTTDDYKVMALSYYRKRVTSDDSIAETFVNVYSTKSRAWRKLAISPFDHAELHGKHGVFVNGFIHWLACEYKTKMAPFRNQRSVIAAFDLAREEFQKLPPPKSVEEHMFVVYKLTVLRGCLAMVTGLCDGVFEFWVMIDYGVQESWTKFSIIYPEDVPMLRSLKVVYVLSDSTEVVLTIESEKFAAYNLSNGVWRVMEFDGIPNSIGLEEVTFMESLISPNHKSDDQIEE